MRNPAVRSPSSFPLDDGEPKPFIFGLMKGEFEVPNDVDAPDLEIVALFYGEREAAK